MTFELALAAVCRINVIICEGAMLFALVAQLATAGSNWFQSQAAASVGGQFRLQMPFTVQGEIGAVQSVSVTLTNGEGTSGASSVQF